MELRQLRYFKVVADARSFARGSQDLRVAQPALSRSIAKLEDEIGRTLFVRHSAGVSLTDAGSRFYDYATQVLGSVRQLAEGMAAESGEPHGQIKLGAPQSIQSKLVLPVAAEFLKKFPGCKLDLVQDSGAHLRDHVVRGTIDIAIVPHSLESGMHNQPLLRESICLLCRKGERPSFGASVDLGDLLNLPLILSGYPDSLRLFIERRFPQQANALNVRCEVNSSFALVDLVMRGVGYGVVPSCVMAQRPEADLAFVPIVDLDVSWAIASNWHRRGLSALLQLEKMLMSEVREIVARGHWPTAHLDE